MTSTIEGDITRVPRGIILHQVNLAGSMSAGIALVIKNKWPIVYQRYMEWYPTASLGDVLFVQVDTDLYVVNLAGQLTYGSMRYRNGIPYTDYDAYRKGIPHVAEMAEKTGLPVLIPDLIGAGLAGGDRSIIHGIIDGVLDNPCYVVYK